MNADFILAIQELGKEKGIEPELLFQAVEEALVTAYKKNFGSVQNVRVDMNKLSGEIHVYAQREVVEGETEEANENSLADAHEIDSCYEVGDIVETEVTPKNVGRIAAQNAKQVVVQRIREAERGMVYERFSSRENDIVTGVVQRIENKNVYTLRHSFATRFYNATNDIKTLSEFLGHADIKTTYRYIYTDDSRKRQGVNSLVFNRM